MAPFCLNPASSTLVQYIAVKLGLPRLAWHVMDKLFPSIIICRDNVFTVGGSVIWCYKMLYLMLYFPIIRHIFFKNAIVFNSYSYVMGIHCMYIIFTQYLHLSGFMTNFQIHVHGELYMWYINVITVISKNLWLPNKNTLSYVTSDFTWSVW